MTFKFQGVHTALITPFDAHGAICKKTLLNLLNYQLQAGVDGVVVLGSTAEAATLEDKERDVVIEIAVAELKGKVPVSIGCGSSSTKRAIEMCQHAEKLGADALQVVTPFYNKPTQEGIYLHFKAVAESVSIPICVYNHPGRTGQNIEVQTLARLAEIPNIVCVKDVSQSFRQYGDIIEKICHKHSRFTLLSGDDSTVLPMMALGAHGVMSVLSNLLPRTFVQLARAMQSGNLALARATHYALRPLMLAADIETNPIPLKYMMQLAHLDTGYLRLPLCNPTKASQEKIEQAINACQHLLDDELHPERFAAMEVVSES